MAPLAETRGCILAVYHRDKEPMVDVLRITSAHIQSQPVRALRLTVAVASVAEAGECLSWGRDFELPIENLDYFETLRSRHHDLEVPGYREAIVRGSQVAARLTTLRRSNGNS